VASASWTEPGLSSSVNNNIAPRRFCHLDCVMAVLDNLFAIGRLRKMAALVSVRDPAAPWRRSFFLNYAFEEEPPMGIPLSFSFIIT
jgi:hypothetical protein